MEELNLKPRFAIPFALNNDLNDNDDIVEFNIMYKPDSTLDNLLDFCDEYTNKRINVYFTDKVDYKVLKAVRRVYKNLYVRLDRRQFSETAVLLEMDIPFYFTKSFSATNWCAYHDLVALGVTDIYIADDLCYDLKRVHEYSKIMNINVRIILDCLPVTTPIGPFNAKSPIWMPHDIDELCKYIDIFEFEGVSYPDAAELDVLYRVWTKQKKWHGNLQEINKDLNIEVNDDYMLPYASKKKMNCERRCEKRVSNSCDLCGKTFEIADLLRSKEARITD